MTEKRGEISECPLINRANESKPFGKVIPISEKTKRGEKRSLDVDYFPFFLLLPENIRE